MPLPILTLTSFFLSPSCSNEVQSIRGRGKYMVHAINDLDARGRTDAYRAAVITINGNRIWLEYRTANDAGLGNYTTTLANNPGLFIREWSTLIDADVRDCENGVGSGEAGDERNEVSLMPGKVWVDRGLGLMIADVEAKQVTASNGHMINVLEFSVHFTGGKVTPSSRRKSIKRPHAQALSL
jgi:hypothetical protein